MVSDGAARFEINPETQQLRFSAPGIDTFVYRDPDMKMSRQWLQGQLKDSRWHIRYKLPVNPSKSKSASVDVDSLWGGGSYTLDSQPGSQRSSLTR